MNSEKDLSAVEDQKEKKNRIQGENGHERWSRRSEPTPQERKKGSNTTISADFAPNTVRALTDGLVQIGRARFSKVARLRKKSEFEHIKRFGRKVSGSMAILIHCPAEDGILRFGIICGRKFDKRAVIRNRARRVLREAFRLVMNGVIESQILLIPKRGMPERTFCEVREELSRLLSKAGLWK